MFKLMLFLALQRHHKRHEDTIFHIVGLQELTTIYQQAYKSPTCLGITQDNPNRLMKMKTFQMALATT
jgi:hypothetical protein